MLGILLGLIAWLADALLSWYFFPGISFFETLFINDPGRTIYVRAMVVILFLIFGLIVGQLLIKSEHNAKVLEENVNLLDGVRKIHEIIVKRDDEKELLAEVLPLIENAFSLSKLVYYSFSGQPTKSSWKLSANDQNVSETLRSFVDEKIPEILEAEDLICLGPEGTQVAFLAPIGMDEQTFGVLYGEFPKDKSYRDSIRCENFKVLCRDLGYAIRHHHDQSKLNTTSEMLTDLYSNAPVGIFTSTVGGKLLFVNDLLAKIMGAESAEALLKSNRSTSVFYADPERRNKFIQSLRTYGSVVDFESDFIGLDGERHTMIFAARLKVDVDDIDTHIEGFAMDVTSARAAERSNRALQKKLAEVQYFKSITVLAGGIAHEFNNILQGMMGSAYLAQMKLNDETHTVWEDLQEIQVSGRRAAKLCDQLLSYAGKKNMKLSIQTPDECLENILKMNRDLDEESAEVISVVKLAGQNAKVKMDTPAFSEIITQLISNAKEALPVSDGEIKLYTEARAFDGTDFAGYQMFRELEPGDYWKLKVIDNGEGIGKENLQHIFEPFYTTRFLGRGLGLPSIAGMVEKFEGSLGVCSTPGAGTEFALWIPLSPAEESTAVESSNELSSRKLDGKGSKIWVVDDEPLICMTIERVLGKLGFVVGTADNGVDGLEKIRKDLQKGIDVKCIILDVTMPLMGGLEMLHYLRALDADLPVLLMSGFDESDSIAEHSALNVNGFIHKPFRMEGLERSVQKILESA
ncbi:response regulator [Kiritimatiellota bacterium B12222]|nr:response regulator [Kiritimatiellota bacterium B12222]